MENINNEFIYYQKINFFNSYINLYLKLLIFVLIIFIFISKSAFYYFKKFYFTQNEITQILLKNYNISDKINLLKIIYNNNKKYYKGAENCLLNDPDSQLCIYHLLVPKKVIGKEKILTGRKKDGSYVILNDFKNIKIAYSFGISKMIQFDKFLADRGIDVYMYDHTIKSLPYRNQKFHWKKIGISGKNNNNKLLKSFEELIIENGHTSEENMILKMDVEHSEWESLRDLPDRMLSQFKYILIEYHFNETTALNEILLYYNVIKKLNQTHQVFYIRCHNRYLIVNFGNNRICKYLEVSYIIRKKEYDFTRDLTIYPINEFDVVDFSKNNKSMGEINLNILKLFDNSYYKEINL